MVVRDLIENAACASFTSFCACNTRSHFAQRDTHKRVRPIRRECRVPSGYRSNNALLPRLCRLNRISHILYNIGRCTRANASNSANNSHRFAAAAVRWSADNNCKCMYKRCTMFVCVQGHGVNKLNSVLGCIRRWRTRACSKNKHTQRRLHSMAKRSKNVCSF